MKHTSVVRRAWAERTEKILPVWPTVPSVADLMENQPASTTGFDPIEKVWLKPDRSAKKQLCPLGSRMW